VALQAAHIVSQEHFLYLDHHSAQRALLVDGLRLVMVLVQIALRVHGLLQSVPLIPRHAKPALRVLIRLE